MRVLAAGVPVVFMNIHRFQRSVAKAFGIVRQVKVGKFEHPRVVGYSLQTHPLLQKTRPKWCLTTAGQSLMSDQSDVQ